MRRELWENTLMTDPALPINVFHPTFGIGCSLRLHWHEHFELIYVESGEVLYQIGGRPFPTKPGDMLFVNSGELHSATSLYPNEPFTVYALVFNPSILGLKEPHIVDLVAPYTNGMSMIASRIEQTDPWYPLLKQTTMQLAAEFEQKRYGYELAVRSYCQLLFTWLSREFTVMQRSDSEMNAFRVKMDRFKELLTRLESDIAERVTVEQAASLVHMSPYHFCRMFKKVTGQTFVQYLNLNRINKAEYLLKNTSMSVTEIAAEIGCSSINSFSKLFRQLRGLSPRDLRKGQSI
ncbi:AraC-like ligand binding domain-containing protein [Paenibacillus catalpae]|uniref:AraC-like ligand binding domain-containing protein n=1 Tax=Paenibacillus catalpae TaxID=1045775 RepID=A0A1I1WVR0_9BACL|nr:AraC family transcriptional regulator [Paenibacillus catalpae]SFD99129.1 AraC-like ligand binding domain-containing protein [Paenibacillus catalpae]